MLQKSRTPDELNQIFEDALSLFNDTMDTDFSPENVKVSYFKPENGKETYKAFSKEYGFVIEDNEPNYYYGVGAEAVVYGKDDNNDVDGILFQLVPGTTELSDLRTFIHEFSHIYCLHNEIQGGHFYNRYCRESKETFEERIKDGKYNAGYAVWRETIARIMTDVVLPQDGYTLKDVKPTLKAIEKDIRPYTPNKKELMSVFLEYIFCCKEGAEAETWNELEPKLMKAKIPFIPVIQAVFDNLHTGEFYSITPEFIYEFGEIFLLEMAKTII